MSKHSLRTIGAVVFVLLCAFAGTAAGQAVQPVYQVEWPWYVTLTQGRDGQLYGTQSEQLFGGCGAAYRIATNGVFTLLNAFSCEFGSVPFSGMSLGTDGYNYGTMTFGGSNYDGVLYRMDAIGQYTVLHNFAGGTDGSRPYAPPIQASDGNFYGTTFGDSATASTIYKYSPSTGTYTSLIQLQESDGALVYSPLVEGLDGNLYGVARNGGANGVGSVFKLTTTGVLLASYSFPGGDNNPLGPLIQASDRNFYGTTWQGSGCGSIYRMTPQGVISVLHYFQPYTQGPCNPAGGLLQATDGYLYGTTFYGGVNGYGTIFRISIRGAYTELYDFSADVGENPGAALMQHTNGTFFGTASYGGSQTHGTIYSLRTGAGPFITFVSASGKPGQTAEILGQGLTGATSVTFNGISATSFSVVLDTYMTAKVPAGATSGQVSVTSPSGTLYSNKSFRVLQ